MRALMGSVAVVRVLMVWTAGVGAGGVLRKRGTPKKQFSIGLDPAQLLSGAILDFVTPEEEKAPQFIFLNPNDPHFVPPEAIPDPKP